MKKLLLILCLAWINITNAQTLTYANFSLCLGFTNSVIVGNNSSLNPTILTSVGNGITWNASGLTAAAGYPVLNMVYVSSVGTPYASLYSQSNYVEYDPALTSVLEYHYLKLNSDSLVTVGTYPSSGAHEDYTDLDKHLIFPFSYGQSFTDTYAKTNYSNASTISSYQNGTRMVTFAGFGTLILPQSTFNNVAMVTEMRTNNLGPNSTYITWYDINTGRKLLYYSENNGNVTVAYSNSISTSIDEDGSRIKTLAYPNPTNGIIFIDDLPNQTIVYIYDVNGRLMDQSISNNNSLDVQNLSSGNYILRFKDKNQKNSFVPIVIESKY
ncbi:MAG TPA: T9SS type A sorting domain-containing protein [Bacteroidia bacterium]|nr:T9SS type A sorting domain-containing protein [Bacteroidia bacterium]HNT79113.1 T9SS type A sorting domain-containing protein [Bacteroidia bacterium]